MKLTLALALVVVSFGSSSAFTNMVSRQSRHNMVVRNERNEKNLLDDDVKKEKTPENSYTRENFVVDMNDLKNTRPGVPSSAKGSSSSSNPMNSMNSASNNNRRGEMSQSLPFMERPAALDGTLAGDVGFDPFGFAKSKDALYNYREAEIKHARLAMLAAAGWPLSEVFDKKIAAALNLDPVLDASDRAPSLLNGGLGKVSPIYWVVTLLAAAAIDVYGIQRSKAGNRPADYFPGNLGFDPFGVYPQDAAGQKRMQLAEIKNGRLAMIAITAFAFQEFVTKLGVVNETPIFFKPASEAFQESANAGYIPH